MTLASREESSEVECCGDVNVQSAVTSIGRGLSTAKDRCISWLSSRSTQLRDAIERATEDTRDDVHQQRCPPTAECFVETARRALGACRQVVGPRVTEAYNACRPGTARLRQSLTCCRAVLAEFVGTFFLVVIGCGSATEQRSYSLSQQQQQDRAVRMALAFGRPTLCLKKVPTFKLSVTLSNLNRFSKRFTAGKGVKFAIKFIRHYPPHLGMLLHYLGKLKSESFADIQQQNDGGNTYWIVLSNEVIVFCRFLYNVYVVSASVYMDVGVAYTSGVYCLRRGTDGHLNPAVTVALTVLQRLSVGRCASFICAQFFGQHFVSTLACV